MTDSCNDAMEYLDGNTIKKLELEVGIVRDKVKDALETIRNWVNQQPHMPKLEDTKETNDWLYMFLFYSKNRIEKVKQHLEAYFSSRSLVPEFFSNRHPDEEGIKSNFKALYLATLPKLTPEGYRIHVFCHAVPDPNAYEPKDFMRRALMMCDWKIKNDLTAGDVIIMHMKHSSLGHWGRYNLLNLSQFISIITKAYPFRIKAIYFINAPSFVGHIINNPFMPGKLKKRIRIHTSGDISEFIQDIPKHCLPKELDGTLDATLDELNESTFRNLIGMKTWFLANEKIKSDESKRPPHLKDNALFGCDGSFRSLDFD